VRRQVLGELHLGAIGGISPLAALHPHPDNWRGRRRTPNARFHVNITTGPEQPGESSWMAMADGMGMVQVAGVSDTRYRAFDM